jgi:hypothetical protein
MMKQDSRKGFLHNGADEKMMDEMKRRVGYNSDRCAIKRKSREKGVQMRSQVSKGRNKKVRE